MAGKTISVVFGDQKKGLILMSNSSNADKLFQEAVEEATQ